MTVRIVQVVSSYYPQIGGGSHVRRLPEGCFEAGDHVVVLTHQVGGSTADESIGGIRVIRFPLTAGSRHYPFSLSLFQHRNSHTADFNLIRAHSYHNVVGHTAARIRLPFVFTAHHDGAGHTPFWAFLHRLYKHIGGRLFRTADAVIRVSEAERDMVMDPRDTMRFTDSLEASLVAGRVQAGGVQLPSWADVVADTRELYSPVRGRVTWPNERDPPDMRTLFLPLSTAAEPRGAA